MTRTTTTASKKRPEPLSLLGETAPFRSLHDDIYTALRAALMSGDMVPGQAVSIRTLAEQFGTSIIPVRDALKRLVAERALTVLPNRTVVVSKMTRRRFQEILTVRLSVESTLARRAAEAIKPTEIPQLEEINDEMQRAVSRNDVKTYLVANQRFHFGLYRSAQSTVMLPIVESLWMQVGPFLNAVFTASGTKRAKDNHADVLKALRRNDSVEVGNTIARDIGDAADEILASNAFMQEDSAT